LIILLGLQFEDATGDGRRVVSACQVLVPSTSMASFSCIKFIHLYRYKGPKDDCDSVSGVMELPSHQGSSMLCSHGVLPLLTRMTTVAAPRQ
jgi:hypothetical protein